LPSELVSVIILSPAAARFSDAIALARSLSNETLASR
jgi:hypothetical protein